LNWLARSAMNCSNSAQLFAPFTLIELELSTTNTMSSGGQLSVGG